MPLIRDPGLRAEPVSQGRAAAERPADGAGRPARSGKAVDRPLRPHRAARPAADADAGRGRGLQRRPQRRPPGQGDAEEHRLRRRRQPGHRRQHERQLTATAARPTPRRTPTNPWWEVDLGAEIPIESIVVCNRTDGDLGKRLDGFTLKVLDAGRNVVFEKQATRPPSVKATFEVGGDGAGGRRSAARR